MQNCKISDGNSSINLNLTQPFYFQILEFSRTPTDTPIRVPTIPAQSRLSIAPSLPGFITLPPVKRIFAIIHVDEEW